jgi:hypothetical protein
MAVFHLTPLKFLQCYLKTVLQMTPSYSLKLKILPNCVCENYIMTFYV